MSKPKADHEEIERQLQEGRIGSVKPLNRSVAFLMTIGFRPAGHWRQGASGGLEPVVATGMGKERDVLYAFASSGEGFGGEQVHYIGKTTKRLRQRMHGYQLPGPTQRTNKAVHQKIVELLAAGSRLDILTLGGQLEHCGLRVSLAAGLEDALIQSLDPPWNKHGRRAR